MRARRSPYCPPVPTRRSVLSALLACLLAPAAVPVCAEQRVLLDDPAFPGRWQVDMWSKAVGELSVQADGPAAAPGAGSLRVTTDWPQDDEFRFFSIAPTAPRGPVPYALTEVALWVKPSGDPHALEVHFRDAEGADRKVGWGAVPAGDWQRLSRPIPAEWPQPLTLAGVTWHNWGLKDAGGQVVNDLGGVEALVDETRALGPGTAGLDIWLSAATPHGIAEPTGACPVALRVLSWAGTERTLSISRELQDSEGQVVSRAMDEVQFSGDYSVTETLSLPRYGAYSSRVTVREGDAELAQCRVDLAFLSPVPMLTEAERLASHLGVNTHVGAPWAAFQRMGIHWARDYSWGWLKHGETAPLGNGRDFATVLQGAVRHEVLVLPVMMGAFRNAAETGFDPDDAAIAAGFERLTRAFPAIHYWELENEYEYALCDKGFDVVDYKRALRASAEGLSRAGKAELVPNGTAGVRFGLTEALLEADVAGAMCAINSHVYTQTDPIELGESDVPDQEGISLSALDQLRLVSHMGHSAGKQSWLTEIGWDVTNGPAVGERLQALYLPRAFLLARWAGMDKVFWFQDRDTPDSTIRFSTCGLLRADGSVRPSGVAMAALSAQTARARLLGDIDLGADTWALVLQQPEGAYTVAAWTVKAGHPLPAELRGAPSVDEFGNPVSPDHLSPAVAYFTLSELPTAWDKQLQAKWLSAPVLRACPSQTVTGEVSLPDGAVNWADLPAGVTAGDRHQERGTWVGPLKVGPEVAPGRYLVTARCEGDGWRRTWRIPLLVQPALAVSAGGTYEPGQAELLTVTSRLPSGRATVSVAVGAGTAAPGEFALSLSRPQRIAVVPALTARGLLTVQIMTDGGLRHEVALRPLQIVVPAPSGRAVEEVPGTEVPCANGTGQAAGAIAARVARTAEGLVVTAQVPAEYLAPGRPEAFWESTNLELFVDPTCGSGGWTTSCRHIWVAPVQEGGRWGLAGGLWLHTGGGGPAAEPRLRTWVKTAGERATLGLLVPYDVIGKTQRSGDSWRAAVSVHAVCSGKQALECGWPRLKGDGLLAGPRGWGRLAFE